MLALFARVLSANCRGDLFEVSRKETGRNMSGTGERTALVNEVVDWALAVSEFFPVFNVNYDAASRCLALIRLV